MQVVVIPNHRVPVVTHMVWYRIGAADEEMGKSGLAHFLEHLMFKGSEHVPPGEFSRRVKALGGQDNAFTSWDYTAYFQSIAVQYLETVMTMEADRMKALLVPEEEFESERSVVIEERRQRTENDPRSFFSEYMDASLFVNHPYGKPIIGWMKEVEAVKREAVIDFHDKYYAPNNAILVVSGDITAEALKPLAEKTYGLIPAKDIPERHWPDVPPLVGRPVLTLHHRAVREPTFERIYRVPSYNQSKEEALAFQVLEEILGGGPSTRLYRALVVEQKKAVNIRFNYRGDAFSYGSITVNAVPTPGVTMADLELALDATLRDFAGNGVGDAELLAAKQRLMDQAIYARDSLSGPAMIVGRSMISGTPLEDIENWPALIAGVTAEQVKDVAVRYLAPGADESNSYVTGYIFPEAKE
jgi:zinc protease